MRFLFIQLAFELSEYSTKWNEPSILLILVPLIHINMHM